MKNLKIILIITMVFPLLILNANTLNNDIQTINASVLHPSSGKVHFFIGQFFHQYNPTTDKLEKMGRIGKDGWYDLTPNVNAALIHPKNKKAYFFIGNMYHRYDFSKKRVDRKGIIGVDGWNGLEGPIDAAIMHPTNNSAYFFKGKKYYRFSFSKDKVDKVGTIGVDGWKGLPANIASATMHPNGKAYFFTVDYYYRYVFGRSTDKKGVIGRDGWRGLFHRLDAAVMHTDDVHFFKSSQKMQVNDYNSNYLARLAIELDENETGTGNAAFFKSGFKSLALRFNPNTQKVTKRKLGYDAYKGIPKDVDAVTWHPENKKYYFFKGAKYYSYDSSKRAVDKVGVIGRDGWKGVPSNLDAATHDKSGIYFFKGTKYYFYSFKSGNVSKTGSIASKFKGVPNYLDAAHSFIPKGRTFRYNGKTYTPSPKTRFMFIKKDVTYSYKGTELTNWELLHQNLFR